MPQIEAAVGEYMTALVLRILELINAAGTRRCCVRLPIGMALFSICSRRGRRRFIASIRLKARNCPIVCRITTSSISFALTEFTQVNHAINRVLVRRARPCSILAKGSGSPTCSAAWGISPLPIARSGAKVVGIEGSAELVRRAGENAAANVLDALVEYGVSNLFEATPESLAVLGLFDKMLIDPPREGAVELVKAITTSDAAGADRSRVLQSRYAGTRRSDPRSPEELPPLRCWRSEYVPQYLTRRVDRAVRKSLIVRHRFL